MRALSGKQFCRLLESQGWRLKPVRGSHHIYVKAGSTLRISVPVHRYMPLKHGLQRHFMKLAGIEKSDL